MSLADILATIYVDYLVFKHLIFLDEAYIYNTWMKVSQSHVDIEKLFIVSYHRQFSADSTIKL